MWYALHRWCSLWDGVLLFLCLSCEEMCREHFSLCTTSSVFPFPVSTVCQVPFDTQTMKTRNFPSSSSSWQESRPHKSIFTSTESNLPENCPNCRYAAVLSIDLQVLCDQFHLWLWHSDSPDWTYSDTRVWWQIHIQTLCMLHTEH